ncbi:hypothetical protein JJQ72_16705 [Paenibacillus sp. F411]|uniref:hypothetical protein n=1 Tax=Paenibacillus sp. F411 TaxID=2820239 RepID=UPI001AAEB106|nr:hypothetical protein [Paenibacillus sp. F411]MBO2945621.1 hypothetical protein [Paenibacillus sp. F411]
MPIIQSDEWAMLFLRKKNELMLRNVLTISLEKYCRDNDLPSEVMALHEFEKHDVAIVERRMSKQTYKYISNTLIELKFTDAYWIILKNNHTDFLRNENLRQDNIWRENYQLRNPPGNEKGIKYDLLKLLEKKKDNPTIAIHHVLALVNPSHEIDGKYKSIVNDLGEKNKCIRDYSDHHAVFDQAVNILKKQLKIIQNKYLDEREFEINSTSTFLGSAYGTNVYLGFVVISENHK